MRKIFSVILASLIIFMILAPLAMAAEDDDESTNNSEDLSFTDMLKTKESYKEVKKSDLNKPVEKTNSYVVGALIFLIFLALSIGLVKYIYGNSNTSSDGLMSMGKVVVGVAFFIFCGIMAFTILTWK
jgi:hypothetical protein